MAEKFADLPFALRVARRQYMVKGALESPTKVHNAKFTPDFFKCYSELKQSGEIPVILEEHKELMTWSPQVSRGGMASKR